jgi:type II protein arginine methyltransferase
MIPKWQRFQPRYALNFGVIYVKQVLQYEISNASYCGLTSVMVPPPRHATGIYNYASVLNSILRDNQIQISILLPLQEEPGDATTRHDEGYVWQIWNTVQTLTNYNARLSVALQIPKDLPSQQLIKQWFAEPVRMLLCSAEVFLSNNKGYPVLSKAHQRFLNSFMRVISCSTCLMSVEAVHSPSEFTNNRRK